MNLPPLGVDDGPQSVNVPADCPPPPYKIFKGNVPAFPLARFFWADPLCPAIPPQSVFCPGPSPRFWQSAGLVFPEFQRYPPVPAASFVDEPSTQYIIRGR